MEIVKTSWCLIIETISHDIAMTLIVGVYYNFMWTTNVVWLQVLLKTMVALKHPTNFTFQIFLWKWWDWHFR